MRLGGFFVGFLAVDDELLNEQKTSWLRYNQRVVG